MIGDEVTADIDPIDGDSIVDIFDLTLMADHWPGGIEQRSNTSLILRAHNPTSQNHTEPQINAFCGLSRINNRSIDIFV
jgi:hypothetical protein